jgi:molybdopterin synthase catalytic subunit
MFILTENIISEVEIREWKIKYSAPSVGAAVSFEGIVRNHNEGKAVSSLEYQAYPEMASKVGNQILEKAKNLFQVTDLFCVHRTGHLQVGEIAVWVLATSSHRRDSFLACEYIINEVKKLVPIWKKEHYVHATADWIACHHCMELHE